MRRPPGHTTRPYVAHPFIHATAGLVIVRPGGLDDRMRIAALMSGAGHRTVWSLLWRGYEVNGGTWPDVEALLTAHGVLVEAPRPLRTSGKR